MARPTFYKRLKVSGIAIFVGLVVQAISLYWSHPMAFIVFILVGGFFVTAGVLLYLYALVSS